jgi:RND superfamily putative drug exporter
MAGLLFRLGRFSFRRRRLVGLLWVVLLAVTGVGAATISDPSSEELSIPGTEAQRAIDLLAERFPQAAADGATARVVIAAPAGERLGDPANRRAVAQVVARVKAAPRVASVEDPFTAKKISPNGAVGIAEVAYRVPDGELSSADRAALRESAAPGRQAGLDVEMYGDAAREPPQQGLAELIGVAVAAIVLIVTLGSLVAAGLPLLTALTGVGIALSGAFAVSGFVEVSSDGMSLALMLGLGVSIDYALFVLSRYRHELGEGHAPEEAAGRAVATAGSAVVFAGLTVIIALAGLSVVGIPALTLVGMAAAVAVAVAVLVALTLLPALIGFAGRGALAGPRLGRLLGAGRAGKGPAGVRWARWVTRHPAPVLLLAVIALGAAAMPVPDLRLGMPDDGTAPEHTTQRKAYDMVAEGFGPGFNGPLIVVVEPRAGADVRGAAQRVGDAIARLPGTAAVMPAVINPAGDTALVGVVPDGGPTIARTEALVAHIRERGGSTGAEVAVTGPTAIDIDMSAKLRDALVPYLAVVVGLAFVLLMLVFRSLLVPLTATAGFLFSVAATFGAVVAVFQWGWLGLGQGGVILNLLPVVMIGLVFGLAMDYQVFLVSRIREAHVHGAAPVEAVVTGFAHGARVVVAAVIIMISVFSGFMLAEDTLLKSFGFALAAGVFFDAVLVRMTIMPAVMTLLGRRSWWLPGWLDRVLPRVDVEGQGLAAPAGGERVGSRL